jgi:hypothetical protein
MDTPGRRPRPDEARDPKVWPAHSAGLAFGAAPLTAPLLYWVLMMIEAVADPSRRADALRGAPLALGVIVAFGAPVAYVAAAAVGWPAYRLLRRTRAWRAPVITGLGASTGSIVAWLLAPSLRGEMFSIPLGAWRGALLGGGTMAVWWWLLHRRAALQRRGTAPM